MKSIFLTAMIFAFCSAPAVARTPGYAIVNVRVFDGEQVFSNATVLVEDGIISRVVPDGQKIKIPKEFEITDGQGKTLIPGLIDSHVHVLSRHDLLKKLQKEFQEKAALGDASASEKLSTVESLVAHQGEKKTPDDALVLFEALAFGVTTVLDQDMSVDTLQYLRSKELQKYLKADLFSSGQWATVDKSKVEPGNSILPMPPENDQDLKKWEADVKQWLDDRIVEGSNWTKLYYDTGFTFELERTPVPSILLHKLGELVHSAKGGQYKNLYMVHAVSYRESLEAVRANADSIVHLFVDMNPFIDNPLEFNTTDYRTKPRQRKDQVTEVISPAGDKLYAELIRAFRPDQAKPTSAVLIPTANAMLADCLEDNISYNYLAAENPIRSQVKGQDQLLIDPEISPYLSGAARLAIGRCFPPNTARPVSYESIPASIRRFHAGGVPVLAGTDAGDMMASIGASVHREIEIFHYSGLSALEALKSATSVPARAFSFLGKRGRILQGYKADLVLVNGDPTQNILDTRKIHTVWKDGTKVDRECYKKFKDSGVSSCFDLSM